MNNANLMGNPNPVNRFGTGDMEPDILQLHEDELVVDLRVDPVGIGIAVNIMKVAQNYLASAYYIAEGLSSLEFNEVTLPKTGQIKDSISNFIEVQGNAINAIIYSLYEMGMMEEANVEVVFTSIDEYEAFCLKENQKAFYGLIDTILGWYNGEIGEGLADKADEALANLLLSYVLANGLKMTENGNYIDADGNIYDYYDLIDEFGKAFLPEDKRGEFRDAARNIGENTVWNLWGIDVEHGSLLDVLINTGASVDNFFVSLLAGIIDGVDSASDFINTQVVGNAWYGIRWLGHLIDPSINPDYARDMMGALTAGDMKADFLNGIYSTVWGSLYDDRAYDLFKTTGLVFQVGTGLGTTAFNAIMAGLTSGIAGAGGIAIGANQLLPTIAFMTGAGRVTEEEFGRRAEDGNYADVWGQVGALALASGFKEGMQYYLGGQVFPNISPTGNDVVDAALRIVLNAGANAVDMPFDALAATLIFDGIDENFGKNLGKNFDAYGGTSTVLTSVLIGAAGDLVGELTAYGNKGDATKPPTPKNGQVVNDVDLRGMKGTGETNWGEAFDDGDSRVADDGEVAASLGGARSNVDGNTGIEGNPTYDGDAAADLYDASQWGMTTISEEKVDFDPDRYEIRYDENGNRYAYDTFLKKKYKISEADGKIIVPSKRYGYAGKVVSISDLEEQGMRVERTTKGMICIYDKNGNLVEQVKDYGNGKVILTSDEIVGVSYTTGDTYLITDVATPELMDKADEIGAKVEHAEGVMEDNYGVDRRNPDVIVTDREHFDEDSAELYTMPENGVNAWHKDGMNVVFLSTDNTDTEIAHEVEHGYNDTNHISGWVKDNCQVYEDRLQSDDPTVRQGAEKMDTGIMEATNEYITARNIMEEQGISMDEYINLPENQGRLYMDGVEQLDSFLSAGDEKGWNLTEKWIDAAIESKSGTGTEAAEELFDTLTEMYGGDAEKAAKVLLNIGGVTEKIMLDEAETIEKIQNSISEIQENPNK